MVVFQPLYKKYFPAPVTPSPAAAPQTGQVTPASHAEPSRPVAAGKSEIKQAQSESSIVVENEVYRITFSSRGAQVKSWVLKKFNNESRQPLDLVNSSAAEKFGYPLSVWTYDQALRDRINSALFVPSQSGTIAIPGSLTFEYSDGSLSVR